MTKIYFCLDYDKNKLQILISFISDMHYVMTGSIIQFRLYINQGKVVEPSTQEGTKNKALCSFNMAWQKYIRFVIWFSHIMRVKEPVCFTITIH